MRPVPIILAIVLALGATEALAYWWMHPAPAGLGQPVLCYRPQARGQRSEVSGQNADRALVNSEKIADAQAGMAAGNSAPSGSSSPPSDLRPPPSALRPPASDLRPPASDLRPPTSALRPPTSDLPSSTTTQLPEVVAKSLPSLHCSTGTAARIDFDDGVTIHCAFFEWNAVNSDNVLEAFKHLPDVCMGSIGMTLTQHQPQRSYQVEGESLSFDHTVFRDPRGGIIHAFKGIWVSGTNSLLGNGPRSGLEQERLLRWKAAMHRFRPAHARVAQGAVHGIPNPDAAWLAFAGAMLGDLKFEPSR
jgi:hypothetical protein